MMRKRMKKLRVIIGTIASINKARPTLSVNMRPKVKRINRLVETP